MEANEISLQMDVKLRTDDRRPAALKLRSWTTCMVKIEGVKCIPPFLRITMHRCDSFDERASIVSVRQLPYSMSINVPGIRVTLAKSDTKEFVYGLFWRRCRRDCSLFLSLESKKLMIDHMTWVKHSLKNLDLHRQFVLHMQRLSRDVSRAFSQITTAQPNEEGTRPLPSLPLENKAVKNDIKSTTRISEIYQEIGESFPNFNRVSNAGSGIYEELKTPVNNFQIIQEEPPALPPPRTRLMAFDELLAMTNSPTGLSCFPLKQKLQSNLQQMQRYSLSSPELDKVHNSKALNTGEPGKGGIETEPKTHVTEDISELARADSLLSLNFNVSTQLPQNFNISAFNCSKVNLFGASGAVAIANKKQNLADESPVYYAVMPVSEEVQKGSLSIAATQAQKSISIYGNTQEHCNAVAEIEHSSNQYENLLVRKAERELAFQAIKGNEVNAQAGTPPPRLPKKTSSVSNTPVAIAIDELDEDHYQTPRRSNISIDEKVPSYYANANSADCHVKKKKAQPERRLSRSQAATPEKPPTKHSKSSTLFRATRKTVAKRISEHVYMVKHATKTDSNTPTSTKTKTYKKNTNNTNNNNNNNGIDVDLNKLVKMSGLQKIDFKFDEHRAVSPQMHSALTSVMSYDAGEDFEYEQSYKAAENATRELKKYSALAMQNTKKLTTTVVDNEVPISSAATMNNGDKECVNNKAWRFGTLPRLHKIDLTSLKLRISLALQRKPNETADSTKTC